MKQNLKRVVACVGAVVLALGGLSACKPQDKATNGKNDLKLKIFFMDPKTPDVKMVEAEVSKIAEEKIGIGVEFNMFDAGTYGTKLPMMIATDEPMDICWTNSEGFAERARKGAYTELDELLTSAPDLYNLFDRDFWKGVSVDGKIYAVPTLKEMAEQWAVYVETDFLKENQITIDPNKIYTLKEMEPILATLKENPDRPGFMIKADGAHNAIDKLNYFDTIMGDFVVNKQTGKVENYYLTKEFENYIRMMRDWYDRGYIASDVATRNDYQEYGPGHNGMSYIGYSPYNEVLQQKYNDGIALTPIKLTQPVISNNSTCGSAFAILEKSKHKEEAIKFLELWNTDPKVKNLITYGIEGVHYNLVDGRVDQVSDFTSKYLNQNWASGNVFISTLLVGEPDDKWEKYKEFNESAVTSSTLGFIPETSSINDKILACQGVSAEYTGLLSCGAVDPDEYLPKLKKSLEQAGVNDVVEEMQRQFDEWKKQN